MAAAFGDYLATHDVFVDASHHGVAVMMASSDSTVLRVHADMVTNPRNGKPMANGGLVFARPTDGVAKSLQMACGTPKINLVPAVEYSSDDDN